MGRNLYMLGILLACCVQSIGVYAFRSSEPGKPAQEFRFHFRFDRSQLDSTYRDNNQSIRELRQLFADPSSAFQVDSISVSASSSMEGYGWHNGRLARDRARAVKGYLVWKYPLLNQYRIYTHAPGEDWQGLYEQVLATPDVPCRDQVLALFDEGYRKKEEVENRIRTLDSGRPYRYLQQNLFPLLRQATIKIFWKDTVLYTGSATVPSSEEIAKVLASSPPKEEPPAVGHNEVSAGQRAESVAQISPSEASPTAESPLPTAKERKAAPVSASTGR